ncbi:hypothetical protein Bca4012_064095 [Brassica carinata]|uniref:Uncharacterized protein n=1 Tax=Brassica carinata TaxID=52824 RepID=A0A8X7V7A4_BRACI|nr:hypothetical protein Bca52824_033675 [Brassica carinata]
MKKRVALARSLIFDTTKEVIEPEVLLYDEPTAGLDPIVSTVVEDFIRSVHLTGKEDALGKLERLLFIWLLTIHAPGGFVFEWLYVFLDKLCYKKIMYFRIIYEI